MEKLKHHLQNGIWIVAPFFLGAAGWGVGFLIGWGLTDIMRRFF